MTEKVRPLILRFPGKEFGVVPAVGVRGVEVVEARHHRVRNGRIDGERTADGLLQCRY